jgi:hypothetical protein
MKVGAVGDATYVIKEPRQINADRAVSHLIERQGSPWTAVQHVLAA